MKLTKIMCSTLFLFVAIWIAYATDKLDLWSGSSISQAIAKDGVVAPLLCFFWLPCALCLWEVEEFANKKD